MARLKIEETVLIGISLFFLILLLIFAFLANDLKIALETGLANIAISVNWWFGGIILFSACYILRTYLSNSWRSLFCAEKLKNAAKQGLSLLRIFIIVVATTVLGMLVSGLIQQATKDRLMNLHILNADKFLTGAYPLFQLNYPSNNLSGLFDFLTPAIIYSFLSLPMIMGFLALFFYFNNNKKLFSGYIISIFISFGLAMPLWYFFPANAPANFLFHGDNPNLNASLYQAVKNYQPNSGVKSFQEKTWETQKNSLPVTTMPSMHWAWSIIIVYYLLKKWPKTIFLSSAWLSLDLFGTIYLGNHYLTDGLVAIPLAVSSIFLANKFTGEAERNQ